MEYINEKTNRIKLEKVDTVTVFWLFMLGSFLGYLIEMIFCFVKNGFFESRQGLLFGPLSPVYGIAVVLMTILFTPILKKNKLTIFLISSVLGGLYEVVCSFVQESVVGSVSWHYPRYALGIFNGRTSLIYMLFWGVLGLAFVRYGYPFVIYLLNRVTASRVTRYTKGLILLLIINIGLSVVAVKRWTERTTGIEPQNRFEQRLDQTFPDTTMKNVYPNMILPK